MQTGVEFGERKNQLDLPRNPEFGEWSLPLGDNGELVFDFVTFLPLAEKNISVKSLPLWFENRKVERVRLLTLNHNFNNYFRNTQKQRLCTICT